MFHVEHCEPSDHRYMVEVRYFGMRRGFYSFARDSIGDFVRRLDSDPRVKSYSVYMEGRLVFEWYTEGAHILFDGVNVYDKNRIQLDAANVVRRSVFQLRSD